MNNLIERALIGYIKLLRVVRTLLFLIAADRSTGSTADLRNTQTKRPLTHLLALAGGDDHAGVRHGNADARDNLCEQLVTQAVVEYIRVNIVRALDTRHADSMRANAVYSLQMLGVHEQTGELVLVHLQTEQNTQTNVVDTAVHRAIHCFGVVVVIVLRTCRMQLEVALLVVGLLKQNVSADAGVLQLAVVLDCGRCNVDVNTSNRTVFMLDGVNGVDALENVLNRVVDRVLTGLNGKTLVTHILQRDNLAGNLFLRQLFAGDMAVFRVIRTVNTAVYAVIRQIQRRKHNNTVAVERQLDLLGQLIHLLDLFGNIAGQQHGGFAMRQTGTVYAGGGLLRTGLFQNAVDQLDVVLVLLGVFQRFKDFLMVDKLLCME